MTLQLSALEPFARGGNRLCFVHPQHPDRCIKVRRPDRPLTKLRAQKRFPKNLRPLSSFDDNLEEFRVMKRLHDHYGDEIFTLVSRCFGFVACERRYTNCTPNAKVASRNQLSPRPIFPHVLDSRRPRR